MKSLFIEFTLRARIAHSELAMQQINLCHDDVPGLVLELHHLRERIKHLKGQQ